MSSLLTSRHPAFASFEMAWSIPGAEGAQHLRDKLAKAGDRIKTIEDFIAGIASNSFLSGKPYLVKFADGPSLHSG